MRQARPGRRRAWAALAWAAGAAALFFLFLRVSLGGPTSSDPANNALEAWDMLHGNLLLHGWILGDVTYYVFEIPVMALVEIFFGLHTITLHLSIALVYLIVTACAVAIAITDSRGASRAVRAGLVAAILSAPTLIWSTVWIPLEFPDHTGTTAFLLVAFLLIDRAPARRFTAPLVCLIMCAGQISDVTVRYVAVPAIVLVCGYRALAARSIRTADGANLLAAAGSVPLALAVRAVMRGVGAYQMVAPKTGIAPPREWAHNAALAWHSVRLLFGTLPMPGDSPAGKTAIFGFCCLLAALAGVAATLWRWRTARRAEQLLLAVIAVNLAVYVFSTLPTPGAPHYLAMLLPASAILAARTLVPARITGRLTAIAATGAAVVAALLPMSLSAVNRPPAVASWAGLTEWLQAHGLRYGLGGYWDGSSVTLQSGGQVQVRTVQLNGDRITLYPWQTDTAWFDPAQHYANFVILDLAANGHFGAKAERFFGKPVSAHRLGKWEVLIYDKNVLQVVKPAKLPPLA